MAWNNQNGGGGPWGRGGGGPWGQGPQGGGPQQPDLEEILKRSQDRLKQAMPGGGMSKSFTALVVLVGLAVAAFFGFTVRINPDEYGVVLRFGEHVRDLQPGLQFRWPYPIEQVLQPKVTRVNRVEIGIRGASDTGRFAGPDRDVPEESLMLTGDENIVDVDFVVFWRINDAKSYLFNIQNPINTVKEIAESAMREVVGRSDIQPILTQDRARAELQVRELIQRTLDSYGAGIQVTQVQLQKVDPPMQVIDAFRDVQAARADQERLQNEARSYANRVVPEARGDAERIVQGAQAYKERVVEEAKGQAARFESVLREYQLAPEVTRQRLFLETMERVLGGTEKIIIDQTGGSGVVPYLPLNEINRGQPAQRSTGQ
ncbi:MAG: FtsH protease activity modulator HflK [Rhizobiales bacterium]|nr:FtsH protease activity modulator HflK [Hyphomicrobiales bacterium]